MDTVQEFQRIREAFNKDQRGFECEKVLGEGKFGKVVKAICRKQGDHQDKAFAIKITPYLENNKIRLKYQDRELRLLVLLNNLSDNANVTKYFGSWIMDFIPSTSKYLCIQMELCSLNLQKFISKNEFGGPQIIQAEGPPRFYQHIFRQILNGLIVIHDLIRWVHRDIHPGNILIKNPNPTHINDITIKIADFGLARPKDIGAKNLHPLPDGTIDTEIEYLTPNSKDGIFMAPEYNSRAYDFKLDVYSAGVLLYLISRDPSGDFSNFKSEVEALKQGQLDNVKQLLYHKDDDKLSSLIKNLVQENPKSRFSAQKAMNHMFATQQDELTDAIIESMSVSEDSQDTDSGEVSETQFLARKENEPYFRVCALNQFTFAAFSAEVKRRTSVTAGRHIFLQERMNDGKKRMVIIEDDEDVDKIFWDAARKGCDVEVVVIKQPEQVENIETESQVEQK